MQTAAIIVSLMCTASVGVRASIRAPGVDSAWRQDAPAKAIEATPVIGRWRMFVAVPNLSSGSALVIKADEKDKSGKKITGTLRGQQMDDIPLKGEFSKGKIKFTISIDTPAMSLDVEFDGKLLEDGTMTGTAIFGTAAEVNWTAKRVDDK